ncbi:hypothetical protein E1B28_006860 [Marasmius oreades]|uniref:Uncharacterized protein n=1 Tax=Marasmius oreades TaxID=181124 RepID=A0A9P7S1T2_9AGAR|nr:uncharacterized protein E1B28_006860 [Marasmius oreades]KAG7093171.1 hypothetical protein E1B28_006860 [Marasmius oreades]
MSKGSKSGRKSINVCQPALTMARNDETQHTHHWQRSSNEGKQKVDEPPGESWGEEASSSTNTSQVCYSFILFVC